MKKIRRKSFITKTAMGLDSASYLVAVALLTFGVLK
ncbi:hypothetical protein BH11BAC5_BH11BAC5_53620 [soil metagenome]